ERLLGLSPGDAATDIGRSCMRAAHGSAALAVVGESDTQFSPDDLAALEAFAGAASIGYTRYLDFRKLESQNQALSDANNELFEANREIRQQSERKSAFLASMSHELRTPMNAIKGFTNLVLRRSGEVLPARQRENLVKVTQASDHLMAMINDLLDLSKIEAGRMDVNPVRFNVKHLIAYCISAVTPLAKEGVILGYECDDGCEAHTDEPRLRQMVINLLSNAIKFTDAGEVKVTARIQDSGENQQAIAGDGKDEETPGPWTGVLEIAVSDTGKGIPVEELATIFDEYSQVKGSESSVQKGTGLGLSITKKFSELLGGTILVESEMGKGSTFTVRIPAAFERVAK
ncbi:MAG: HAMP domain-containing sensor histidine kinase, partial [bacterium]|nr:HAMP domain-containing sensor histidine kinase [bacterium]